MTRRRRTPALIFLSLAIGATTAAAAGPFDGEWRTTIGLVKLKQVGPNVTGTYGNAGQFAIKGKVDGKVFRYDFTEGNAQGTADWTLDEGGNSFHGQFEVKGGRKDEWNGWRRDPAALKGPEGKFAGLWMTTLGLMELTQDGAKVQGRFALRGDSTIEGKVKGRELDFSYKVFNGGKGWFDLSADGKTLSGGAQDDGFTSWFGWSGRPAPEFVRDVPLQAGKILDGSTKGLLTYTVRAPEGFPGPTGKTWPAVVILHGSNMNGRDYVATIASAWPDLARDFLLIGINGERPSNTGPDPKFNFSYVNYVGRSNRKGFPGTDRESPALVADALAELKGAYPIARFFVGGHSQGGFLAYSVLMNSPELIAGAFPMSCGLIFQAAPEAYDDEPLKKAQRAVPLAIIHGKTDPVVDPGMGSHAAGAFRDAGWPAIRFFNPDQGGHMFGLLPVNEAIRWLDDLASNDPDRLLRFAEARLGAKSYRDVTAALARYELCKPDGGKPDPRVAKLARAVDAEAKPKAAALLGRIRKNDTGWIDPFLDFRDDFQYAPASKPLLAAFDDLRKEQEAPAREAINAGNAAFRQNNQAEGYKKYQEVVDKYPASTSYRTAKQTLAQRR